MNRVTEKILKGASEGTTLMTLYSYAISDARKKTFMEPDLLAILIKRLFPSQKEKPAEIEGWMLHYVTGLAFTTVYHYLFSRTKLKPSLAKGIWLGAASGLLGSGIWKAAFTLHPAPPGINYKDYYLHLILAHMVFGLFVADGYKHPKGTIA
jgi:hypothetical protein